MQKDNLRRREGFNSWRVGELESWRVGRLEGWKVGGLERCLDAGKHSNIPTDQQTSVNKQKATVAGRFFSFDHSSSYASLLLRLCFLNPKSCGIICFPKINLLQIHIGNSNKIGRA